MVAFLNLQNLRPKRLAVTLIGRHLFVSLKLTFPFYAPINVKPQGGGADPGKFDILIEANAKFPIPGHLQTVKFPTPGYLLIIPALELKAITEKKNFLVLLNTPAKTEKN